jgi:membrane peptidoglycan carboxypeptidase
MASVLGISDAQGHVLYTYHKPRGVQVVAPQYAYLITSILKDNYARVLAFGPGSSLQLGPDNVLPVNRPAAAKTGTSQDFRDNLTIGYTPNLLTAVWVGNPDNSRMNQVEGVTGAGPIWHDLMEWSLVNDNLPYEDFAVPPGMVLARVSSSGYLADRNTAWPITDVFAAGSLPHLYDPGYGPGYNNYLQYRRYSNDFSVDGGTTTSLYAGVSPLAPTSSTAPLSSTGTISGTTGPPPGYVGTLSQRPSPTDNLCGGRRWTYTSIYQNGKLAWQYTCQ